MRAWYVDRRNEPILDVRMMVSFACALVLVLAWLLPREEFFRQMLAEGRADHVSIAYARLLVAMYPDDAELRMLLAAQYQQIGALKEAWAIVGSEEFPPSVLRATLILELGYASRPGPDRRRWEALLERDLTAAVDDPDLDETVLAAFGRAAYAIDQPRLAAQFFERRYQAHGELSDLLQAVAAWRAADDPTAAARLFAAVGLELDEPSVRLGLDVFLAAGTFEAGFAFIERWLAGNRPEPGLAAGLAGFAQLAGDAQRTSAYLALVGDGSGLDSRTLLELAGIAIASGRLDMASIWLERLLTRQPDEIAAREELARVYRWNGDPDRALTHWLALVEATGDEMFVAEAWSLAQGLYRYEVSARLLTRLAGVRRLTDEEVTALKTAYELQGLPDAGIRVLSDYVRREPGHRAAWLELIGLTKDNEYLEAADASWRAFAAVHPLTVQERLRWADLLWERYHTEEAVDVMLSAGNPEVAEFWRRLTAYAWFLDDMALAGRAYAALATLEPLDSAQYERYLFALTVTAPDEVRFRAMEAWASLDNPTFFLQAMQWAVKAGDYQLVEALLADASAREALLAGSADYWELVAYYHQLRGDADAARQVLGRGLEHHPGSVALVSAYLWALTQTDDQPALRTALARYRPLAERRSELWPAFASGHARLGEHRHAAAWFARAVAAQPDDLGLLLAYAGSLDALGLKDPAYRLRRHVIGEAIGGNVSGGLTLAGLTSASTDILSPAQQRALAAWLDARGARGFAGKHLPALYLSQALAEEHYTAARYWLDVDPEPDVWHRLAVASEQRNRPVLESLLEHGNADVRIQAALALDRLGLAYREARTSGMAEGDELRALTTTFHARYPSGWQVGPEFTNLSDLDIEGLRLRGAGRLGELRLDAELDFYTLTDAARLIPGSVDEVLWQGSVGFSGRLGDSLLRLTALDSDGALIGGFVASQELALGRRNRLSLGAAWQQLTEITALARLATQRSGVDLGWQNTLGRHDVLSVRGAYDLYDDRSGTRVGEGGQMEVRYDHAFLIGTPHLTLGTSLYMTRNSEDLGAVSLPDDLFFARGERLLPEATNRFSLNGMLSRGHPGELGWELPGPRYRFGASVGYQWPESSPTLELEASLGFKVLGNDELGIRTAYSSSLLGGVGGDGYRASLTYSRRLGH
ncbi:MAG: tetratricopeptide repeat protein [Pseudomonadales bacterium]